MIVIIMGAPGSGKGTQCSLLAEKGFKQFSTGDLLRREVQKGSVIGKKVKATIESGNLVADALMEPIIGGFLATLDPSCNIILDGYPRTIEQAETLASLDIKNLIKSVIHLDVTEATLIKRLSGRIVCANCGATYHKEYNKPRVAGTCDSCGLNKLYTRDDDSLDKVSERLKIYEAKTKAIIDYYLDRGILATIKAEGNADDIYAKILLSLNL